MSDSSKNKIHKLLKASITKAHILELVKEYYECHQRLKYRNPNRNIQREELQAISDVFKIIHL